MPAPQDSDPAELTSESLSIPTFRRAGLLLGRAIRLRCPVCGSRTVLASWFHLHDRCAVCGLQFERGEPDYYLGGILLNLLFSELLFAMGFVTFLIVRWPNIPWDGLEWVLGGAVIVAPIVFYPVSKVLWLACDLLFRPRTDTPPEHHNI